MKVSNIVTSHNTPIKQDPPTTFTKPPTNNFIPLRLRRINRQNETLKNKVSKRALTPTTRETSEEKQPEAKKVERSHTPHKFLSGSSRRLLMYVIGCQLGTGAYSTVRLATNRRTREQVAIKTYDQKQISNSMTFENIQKEISVLHKLKHPNIIELREVINAQDSIHIITEYIGGSSLLSYLKSNGVMKECEAKYLFRQIVSAIDFCHSNKIAHRDIKLDNILIGPDKNIKIIDFGFSIKKDSHSMSNSFCGTPNYMGPELVKKQVYDVFKSDIWALGVLLYAMLSGRFPFTGSSKAELFNNILVHQLRYSKKISSEAKELIDSCLRVRPEQRPDAKHILDSAWLKEQEQPPKIDQQVVKELRLRGFKHHEIENGLKDKTSDIFVLYNYLCKQNIQIIKSLKQSLAQSLIKYTTQETHHILQNQTSLQTTN